MRREAAGAACMRDSTQHPSACKVHIHGAGRRSVEVEAVARQVSKHDGRARDGTDAVRHRDAPGATRPQPSGAGETLPPLPQRVDTFTEDQMCERFGVPGSGGIRESSTSSGIILVRNAHGGCDDAEEGERVIYNGKYCKGHPDQMIPEDPSLARSKENGGRVLYFVKKNGKLCSMALSSASRVATRTRARPGTPAFDLVRVEGAGAVAPGIQDARDDRRGGPLGSRTPSAPDLDMVAAVERQISGRGRFAGRSELLAALPKGMDSASLDRILKYLEHSAKISTGDEGIRWTFNDARQQDSNPDKVGASLAATAAAEEPVYILSREERRPADLDNDLPYSEDIEQMIADCEAGRPIGKTYTAEEYRRHLKQEFGIGALDNTGK